MIVYVTGCLGFIGSTFTEMILEKGWTVFGIDKITYAANLDMLGRFQEYKNFKFIKQDIKDIKHLYESDYIINFAAESHVGNSIIDSTDFVKSNIEGVRNILELLRVKSSEYNRPGFLQISTDEVYGDITAGAHTEQDVLNPSNPYSATKAAADLMITAWARTYDLEYIIIRPTNNYGERQYPEKLIPLSISNLKRNKKVRLHDGGLPKRNWLHVEDTCGAILAVIARGEKNQIYNISGNTEQENNVTVKKIIQCFFEDPNVEWKKYIDYSYNRPGQDIRYSLCDKKIKALGWKPKKKFDLEIKKIVDFYRTKVFM